MGSFTDDEVATAAAAAVAAGAEGGEEEEEPAAQTWALRAAVHLWLWFDQVRGGEERSVCCVQTVGGSLPTPLNSSLDLAWYEIPNTLVTFVLGQECALYRNVRVLLVIDTPANPHRFPTHTCLLFPPRNVRATATRSVRPGGCW